jgi:hypothetical protein
MFGFLVMITLTTNYLCYTMTDTLGVRTLKVLRNRTNKPLKADYTQVVFSVKDEI